MSVRRAQSLPPHMFEQKPTRGKCISCICFSWKVITCIVSHVTLVLLVVSYCVGGAYLFKHLEEPHELEVKKSIQHIRKNLTDKIWKFSENASVLSENDWIESVKRDLSGFEEEILTAMKTNGWDGDEDILKSQWTLAGSLFYSIIVITTIGYGHISPRTDWGKVTTIFYAIIGIPLMLLCLSNIGDIMATSFRFIYWRVCCYVCTRTASRQRQRPRQRQARAQRFSSRSQPPPYRRSIKLARRPTNETKYGRSVGLQHAYSDPELRTAGRSSYNQRGSGADYLYGRSGSHRISGGSGDRRHLSHNNPPKQRSSRTSAPYPYEDPYDRYADPIPQYTQTLNRNARFSSRHRQHDRMRDRHTVERERYLGQSKPRLGSMEGLNVPIAKRTQSVRSVRHPSVRHDEISRPRQRESREMRELNRLHLQTLPRGRSVPAGVHGRAKSVDPRLSQAYYAEVDEETVRKTHIFPNRYAIDKLEHRENRRSNALRSQSMPRSALSKHMHGSQHHKQKEHSPTQQQRDSTHSNPQQRPSFHRQNSARFGDRLELPDFNSTHQPEQLQRQRGGGQLKRGRSPRPDCCDDEFDECCRNDYAMDDDCDDYPRHHSRHREPRRQRRERPERLPPSPRIMSPMGFAVKRQVRRRPSFDYDEDSIYGDECDDYYGVILPKDRPVPIWLCVFLVVSYILGGAALFAYWEQWSFLDSAYFCFITLTTIGFGDFVPAKGVKDESQQSIAYCSLYLLFGIALLAMSFNLVQEEFIANVKEVARRLGILKDEEDDD